MSSSPCGWKRGAHLEQHKSQFFSKKWVKVLTKYYKKLVNFKLPNFHLDLEKWRCSLKIKLYRPEQFPSFFQVMLQPNKSFRHSLFGDLETRLCHWKIYHLGTSRNITILLKEMTVYHLIVSTLLILQSTKTRPTLTHNNNTMTFYCWHNIKLRHGKDIRPF